MSLASHLPARPLAAASRVALLLFAAAGAAWGEEAAYRNPVLAGDYPDPSIIRVGRDYWATATTSEWGPQFPLLHSRDLVNWENTGPVFAHRPEWAVGNFWAPEISEWKGRYFIYYVGRKRNGPLSVAVASADRPQGPYTDHGPIVSQEDGSIDPVPVTNENGERWLVWKEDGNSRRQPTPLWAQRLDEAGTKLIGERFELMRNDAPWEGAVVEGPYILKRGDYYYLFYSGSGCCGRGCAYALGVARARALLGPWEKDPRNPILGGSEAWKCPGHGSIVVDEQGRDWLLYHAYDSRTFVFTGREMFLDEVKFGPDDWPVINSGAGPSVSAPSPFGARQLRKETRFFDRFRGKVLWPGWQWPQDNEPSASLIGGRLLLAPQPDHAADPLGAIMARATTSGDYVATAALQAAALRPGVTAGLAAIGDPANALGISVGDGKAIVWQRVKNQRQVLAEAPGVAWPTVHLRLTATGGIRFQFAVSHNGHDWKPVGEQAEGGYLPPWDRSVRVGLTVGGTAGAAAQFDYVRIEPTKSRF